MHISTSVIIKLTGETFVFSVSMRFESSTPNTGMQKLYIVTFETGLCFKSITNRIKLQQMIGDDSVDQESKNQLTRMANMMNLQEESKWKKAANIAGKSLGVGLNAAGLIAENFWPMHDAYHRYKTMGRIGNAISTAGDTIMNILPFGHGYRKHRKRRHNKKRSKLKFGGMIIPPKNLKKMFENNKCKCKI